MIDVILDGERFPAFYRVIVPAFASTPRSGMGAARQGGRFNRPRQEALLAWMAYFFPPKPG